MNKHSIRPPQALMKKNPIPEAQPKSYRRFPGVKNIKGLELDIDKIEEHY